MGKTTNAYKVKLIKGVSFVIPGHKFLAGQWVQVDKEIADKLKPSQQFDIKPADEIPEEEPEVENEEASEDESEETAPAKKPRRKRR